MATTTSIAGRLEAVRAEIAAACERADRDRGGVQIVGVTKTHPLEVVAEALEAGLEDFGENRAQELLPKAEAAAAMGLAPRWHFVGHLQRNKVRQLLPQIVALHSLDSLRLAGEIERRASELLPCYLEINVGGEASKEGADPAQLPELLRGLSSHPHVEVVGLMTVAPFVDDPELVRPVFRRLRELAEAHGLAGLSMGMTGDYHVAVEEGASVVRLGRVLFGERRA